jgi:hypothetical protein
MSCYKILIKWQICIKINTGRWWSLLQVLGTIEIILLLSALRTEAIQIIAIDELIYFVK